MEDFSYFTLVRVDLKLIIGPKGGPFKNMHKKSALLLLCSCYTHLHSV